LLALVLVAIVSWASVRSTPFAVDRAFRILQFASASLYSLGHGGNDAQKTMGIIAVLLYSNGSLGEHFYVPFWVVLACQAAMAMGTLLGGWRIVRTMGLRITKLTRCRDLCGDRWGCDAVYRDLSRCSGFDHAYHHRRHRRRRRGAAGLGGTLERREFDRLCLGDHHSGLGGRRGAGLLAGVGVAIIRLPRIGVKSRNSYMDGADPP